MWTLWCHELIWQFRSCCSMATKCYKGDFLLKVPEIALWVTLEGTTITPTTPQHTTSQSHKLTTWQTAEGNPTLRILQVVFEIQMLPQVYHCFLRWHVPFIVVCASKVATAGWLGCCLPGIPWSSGKARFLLFDSCPWNQHRVFQCNATQWCTRMMYLRSLSILTCGAVVTITIWDAHITLRLQANIEQHLMPPFSTAVFLV